MTILSLLAVLVAAIGVIDGTPVLPHLSGLEFINQYLSRSKSQPQREKGPVEVCPFSHGGFHVVYQCGPYFNAESVCQSFNWTLARIDDFNLLYAAQVGQECVSGRQPAYWVASFNGQFGSPCAFMLGGDGVVLSGATGVCDVYQFSAFCQELPIVTVTESTTTTTTTSFGVDAVVTTVTRHPEKPPQCCGLKQQPQVLLQQEDPEQVQCHKCGPACAFENTNLRVLKRPTEFNRAEAACNQYGWHLADFFSGEIQTIVSGLKACDSDNAVWIRSYNGVSGAKCIKLVTNFLVQEDYLVYFGFGRELCEERFYQQLTPPLCKCQEWLPTGLGPAQTSTITTTTTTTIEDIVFVTSLTTTFTVTTCQGCTFDSPVSSSETGSHHCSSSHSHSHSHHEQSSSDSAKTDSSNHDIVHDRSDSQSGSSSHHDPPSESLSSSQSHNSTTTSESHQHPEPSNTGSEDEESLHENDEVEDDNNEEKKSEEDHDESKFEDYYF